MSAGPKKIIFFVKPDCDLALEPIHLTQLLGIHMVDIQILYEYVCDIITSIQSNRFIQLNHKQQTHIEMDKTNFVKFLSYCKKGKQATFLKENWKDVLLKYHDFENSTPEEVFKFTRELLNCYSKDFLEFQTKVKQSGIVHSFYNKHGYHHVDDFVILIIGCPYSKDNDTIAVIDLKYDVNKVVLNPVKINEQIYNLGKDTSKEIDLNVIQIQDGIVVHAKKGSIKTLQGILYYTQVLHMPESKCIPVQPPERFKLDDRIKPYIHFIFCNLKVLLTKNQYDSFKSVLRPLSNVKEKFEFMINHDIVNIITNNILHLYNNDAFKNIIKSLFFKMCTLEAIHHDMTQTQDYYTKKGMASIMSSIYNCSIEKPLYFLFRGEEGHLDCDFFKTVFCSFLKFSQIYVKQISLSWTKVNVNITAEVPVNRNVCTLFWENPVSPSDKFIVAFQNEFKDGFNIEQFNTYFQIPSCAEDDLAAFPEFQKQVCFCSQRSPEWFAFRDKYPPNGKIKENAYQNYEASNSWVKDLFHLIAGSLGELVVMYGIDWSRVFPGYTFVTIGLIKNDKGQSIAPDGFLINATTKDIVPVEIKCLRQSKNAYSNANVREQTQANLQLQTLKSMLTIEIKTGIIVFLYMCQDVIDCEYVEVNL